MGGALGMFGWCLAALAASRVAHAAELLTNVTTAAEFAAAVESGAAHIRVLEHLDLRGLELDNLCPNKDCVNLLLFRMQETTESIQVRAVLRQCRVPSAITAV